MAWKALTDAEWELISPFIPVQKRGRPRSRNREILDAILFILSTNCRWEELPPCFPPKMTVFDRFKRWQQEGFFETLFHRLKEVLVCFQSYLDIRHGQLLQSRGD